jgi:hypothetical protein
MSYIQITSNQLKIVIPYPGRISVTGLADAPSDSKTYGRKDAAWVETAAAADLANKVDKVTGKALSTNDLTNELKSAYDGAVSGLANKVDSVVVFNDQADSYALLAGDKNKHIRMQKSTANNFTINDVFASGECCTVEQNGAGQVTFVAGANVTILSAESLVKTRVRYSGVSIMRTPTSGVYIIFGDLTA